LATKAELRATLLKKRKQLTFKERAHASQLICTTLINSPIVQTSKTIMSYISLHQEVDLTQLHSFLWEIGSEILIPTTNNSTIIPVKYSPEDELTTGEYGVSIPKVIRPANESPTLILAPLIGADLSMYRIGYGKGYYDRYLNTNPTPTIGVSFQEQVIYSFHHEPFDIPLDMLITENFVIK
jgi:5-formyltetrahydrofolate cyclo-ligase